MHFTSFVHVLLLTAAYKLLTFSTAPNAKNKNPNGAELRGIFNLVLENLENLDFQDIPKNFLFCYALIQTPMQVKSLAFVSCLQQPSGY